MRVAGIAAFLLLAAASLEAQRKKGTVPAPLPVTANTVSPGVVLVAWPAVQKVSEYHVTRCEGTTCTLKTRLSAFAPREMRDNLTASGTYLYKVTAFGGNQLPLAEGQVGYQYTAPAPITVVLMPPPSGTATPANACTQNPTQLMASAMAISIVGMAPTGADLNFEAWQQTGLAGYAVDRAPPNSNVTGTGWTPAGNTCDNPTAFATTTMPNGAAGMWFRDPGAGLTVSNWYIYRVRAIYTNGFQHANVSSQWQAPPPLAPLLQPPTRPTPAESDDIVLWLHWDQPTVWNSTVIRRPDEFQIASSWGLRDSQTNTRCPCAYPIRTTANMPTGQQTVYITARWGTVSATVSQWVTR